MLLGEEPAAVRGAEYFGTIGIPVLRGRSFTAVDGPDDAPVAVVSQAFAGRFFRGEDPLAQRSREIGVRMAMGADRSRIRRLVLSEAGRLLAVGLLVGSAATLVLGRLLTAFLFQVRPLDPIAFVVAVSTVTLATPVAAWVPASRASRRNPMTALRSD